MHRRDTFRAEGVLTQALQGKDNITFIPDTRLIAFSGEGKISGVLLENVKTGEHKQIGADGVFVSIGRIPVSDLFSHEVETDENGYVIADESTHTNIEGVFAVGDLRTKPLRQIVTAVADGAVAVHYTKEYLSLKKPKGIIYVT